MSVQLIHGSAHSIPIPDGSIHCLVTSPPYWSLRAYAGDQSVEWPAVSYAPMPGLPEMEIPGCAPDCDHVWVDGPTTNIGRNDGGKEDTADFQSAPNREGRTRENQTQGAYCRRCGGWRGGLGLEPTIEMYIGHLILCLREWWRVLRDDGTAWVNLGDSYASSIKGSGGPSEKQLSNAGSRYEMNQRFDHGLKPKDLCLIPYRFALAAQADGWYVRSAIVWAKGISFCPAYAGSVMPESARDRPTNAYEMVYLLTKSSRYFYDAEAVRETGKEHLGNAGTFARNGAVGQHILPRQHYAEHRPERTDRVPSGRNLRNVWALNPQPFSGAVSYGTYRIASQGCPMHDYQTDLVHALRCDEQQDVFHLDHNLDSNDRPAQLQEGAVVSIPLGRYGLLFDESFAIPHSNQNHKNDSRLGRDVIFYGIPSGHTEYMQYIRRCVARYDRIPENNISEDFFSNETEPLFWVQNSYRILGICTFQPPDLNSQCTCYYTGKVKKRKDHFAVFPESLVEPCIKAGSSEHGVCGQCGAPWTRVVERTNEIDASAKGSRFDQGKTGINGNGRVQEGERFMTRSTGWQPSCACYRTRNLCKRTRQDALQRKLEMLREQLNALDDAYGMDLDEDFNKVLTEFEQQTWRYRVSRRGYQQAPTVPAIVCDPFHGSGTSGAVAVALRRNYVGVDISQEYLEDHDRISGTQIRMV